MNVTSARPRFAALLIALIAGTVGAASPAGAATAQAKRDAALTTSLRAVVRQASIPGAIVGVWQKGRAPYVRTFGIRDERTRRPMTRDLYMRIGSETKTFTVTAILQLVDQGKLTLDDPIAKFMPGVVDGDTITIRELASMRSGLKSYTRDEAFVRTMIGDPHQAFTPQQLLAYTSASPLLFAPGSAFDYSNTNTVLLGLVVEKLSGQPLPAYIRQHILRPLKMRHTSFATDAAFPSPHADGYTDQTPDGTVADATDWSPSWGWAAGAMISTLADMRIWAEHVATGRGLLKPATQRLRAQSLAAAPDAPPTYGLGLFNVAGWIGHNGSLPGYQTVVVHRAAPKTTLVALMNTDISHEGYAPSTLVVRAITQVISPRNVYTLPAAPAAER